MQFYQLEQFCATARTEHMSRAAASMHISQPTLSLNIARLEDELGIKLFDRSGRNIRLNKYGKKFLFHVERALDELEMAKQAVANLDDASDTQINLADSILNNTYNMLSAYMEKQPQARFNHQTATIPEVLVLLESGTIDLAVAVLAPDYDFGKYIQWAPVMVSNLMVLMPQDHRLAGREEVPLRELAREPLMYAIKGFDARDSFDKYCESAGFAPNYVYTSIKPFLFNELSREHGYLSIITDTIWNHGPQIYKRLQEEYISTAGLVGVRITEPECQVSYGVLTCKGHYLSRQAKDFKEFASNYLLNSLHML